MQPARHLIESLEPRTQPTDPLARVEKRADPSRKLFDDALRRRKLLMHAPFAQLEQRFLRRGKNLIRLLFPDQAPVDQRLRAENQLPKRRLVLDDANIAFQI